MWQKCYHNRKKVRPDYENLLFVCWLEMLAGILDTQSLSGSRPSVLAISAIKSLTWYYRSVEGLS